MRKNKPAVIIKVDFKKTAGKPGTFEGLKKNVKKDLF